MNNRVLPKILVAIFFILLCFAFTFAQSDQAQTYKFQPGKTYEFETKKGSHTARLIFQDRLFDKTKHKVFTDKKNQTFIDGREAFGTDNSIPTYEISSVKLYIDGKEIPVSRKLYSDCYEPIFSGKNFNLAFSRDSKSVIVVMHGSDAAAAYHVTWKFRKNGRHTRKAYQDFNYEEDSEGGKKF